MNDNPAPGARRHCPRCPQCGELLLRWDRHTWICADCTRIGLPAPRPAAPAAVVPEPIRRRMRGGAA